MTNETEFANQAEEISYKDMWQVDLTEGDADMTLFFDSIKGGSI